MSMAFYQLLWSLLFFLFRVSAQKSDSAVIVGAGNISVAGQTYNWDPKYRCRLLAHASIVLQNNNHHVLVFDGGAAKYKFTLDGKDVEVLDLNGWTVTVDLTKSFNTQDFAVKQIKKATNIPVINRFGIWADSNQDSVYIQGGHFYTESGWDESQYHINGSAIPPYSIWRFDLESQTWTDITTRGNSKKEFKRAVGGASVSVPSMNQSFYAGGIVTSRSDVNTAQGFFVPQVGMLAYEHDNDNLYNGTYGSPDEQGYGYWHGSLNHMKLGPGNGFLISLMAEKDLAGVARQGVLGGETGEPVTFEYVLLYDLNKNKWYKQETTSINNGPPITRTRFCGQTVYSNDTNTWELWIYGGQLIDDKSDGVDDIYVLSMPSFIWTKVFVPPEKYRSRGHSCHALGSQLLIVGGYLPGMRVDPYFPCSKELIRVFDMNEISWKSSYNLDTVYSTPKIVRNNAELDSQKRREPYLRPWGDIALKDAFDYILPPPLPPPPPPFSPWKIAVIVICILIVFAAIAAISYYCVGERKKELQPGGVAGTSVHELPDSRKQQIGLA